ncbi:hypothetical protein F383_37332 [Gossypium arboreum]|uniref:Uncharacterized protein n=1 Tax=Gossypium arboreum TaxID=29729 RepID=A0A0B0MBA9_GOSAR|nr:hypothetical protein F383_37332 [Gossypium arboreum]
MITSFSPLSYRGLAGWLGLEAVRDIIKLSS